MHSNRPGYPAPTDEGHRYRSKSVSGYNKNKYEGSRPPPFGEGWKANTSFGTSANRSVRKDRNNESRNDRNDDSRDWSHRNVSQSQGRFHIYACAEAYKDKMSQRRSPRGAGSNANKTFHGDNRSDKNSSRNGYSIYNQQKGMSNNFHQRGPSDKRNLNYGGTNKPFSQKEQGGRYQSGSCDQQYFNHYHGGNLHSARDHLATTTTHHPSSDWKMPGHHSNYGGSQTENHSQLVRNGSYGRSSSTSYKPYAGDEKGGDNFRGVPNFTPTSHTHSSNGYQSSRPISRNNYSRNRKSSSGSARDANTAFHHHDVSDSDWANKAILPDPSDRPQRFGNKAGYNNKRNNFVGQKYTKKNSRFVDNLSSNATCRGMQHFQNESSMFNQTCQDLSETVAEDVSINFADQSAIDFEGDSTMDDDVFDTTDAMDTTGLLNTSVLPTGDIQNLLNGSINDGVSRRRIGSSGSVTEKKKLIHKTKTRLNQSFAEFESVGPSPILEANEETDSPMVKKVKGGTPLRVNVNVEKPLLDEHPVDLPEVHSPRVKIEIPHLKALIRKKEDPDFWYEFPKRSQSCDSAAHRLVMEEVKQFHKLKRTKSYDVIADSVSFGVTRDTTSIYDRSALSVWKQDLPFKKVAPAKPTFYWRYFTKIDKKVLPFTLESLNRVGRFIAHRGFVPKMPYLLVFNEYVFYHSDEGAFQMMPPKFEFDLLPYSPCPVGELVSGLYEYLDKNEDEYYDYQHCVENKVRVVNKAPEMRKGDEVPLKITNLYVNLPKMSEKNLRFLSN